MEHIEEAESFRRFLVLVTPVQSCRYHLDEIRRITRMLAMELKVKGLMNLQLALKDGEIYVLEVNPRASRTIPFVFQGHWCAAGKGRRTCYGRQEAS